jgi:hypothetical protein
MIRGPKELIPPLGRLRMTIEQRRMLYDKMVDIRAKEKQREPHVSLRVRHSVPDLFPFPDFSFGALVRRQQNANEW